MNPYLDRNGRALPWVAEANRRHDQLLRAGKICAGCGRFFGKDGVEKSTEDKTVCLECKRDCE